MIYILALLFSSWGQIHAEGLWDFKDLAGFEKCMIADHVVDKNKTATGSQERFLAQGEIQTHCMETATKIASANKSEANEYMKTTRRVSAHETALPFALMSVENNKSACEDPDTYETMKEGLSHPQSFPTPTRPYFKTARAIVKTCLVNADFKKDIVEDAKTSDHYFQPNVCQILKQEKVASSCPK